MPHVCGEEVAMILAAIPGLSLVAIRFKAWWHARHFRTNHKPFQPHNCPHDHKEC